MAESSTADAEDPDIDAVVEITSRGEKSTHFVSASDVERHTYCPLSWHLSRKGVAAAGSSVDEGIARHAEISEQMNEYRNARSALNRQITIWTWWFGIIIAYAIDAVAFFSLTEAFPPKALARYLVMLALVWMSVSITLIVLPWREWFNWNTAIQSLERDLKKWVDEHAIASVIEAPDFKGGWTKGGRVEASLLLGTIVLTIHGVALWGTTNREQAGFILLMVAMLWTLFSSWRLQQALVADLVATDAVTKTGLDEGTDVVYSDSGEETGILMDDELGLSGKPDQIVVIDGEFIPLEQKTGKIPHTPFPSHKMQLYAYLRLIEANTPNSPPYGVLRYGESELHQIAWDDMAKQDLQDSVSEIQRLMREGGAARNHERPGKCQNCSRRRQCPDSLV